MKWKALLEHKFFQPGIAVLIFIVIMTCMQFFLVNQLPTQKQTISTVGHSMALIGSSLESITRYYLKPKIYKN